MNDPYQTLGISSTATLEEARAAWLQRVRVLHPDRFDPVKQKKEWNLSTQMLQEVNAAWETIRTGGVSSSNRGAAPPPYPRQESAQPPQSPPPPVPPEPNSHKDFFTGKYSAKNCPFKRYFARAVDTCLALAVLWILATVVKSATSDVVAGLVVIVFVLLYPTIEGLMLAEWGSTPGKFIFGIRVLNPNGQFASTGRAIYRSYLVQLLGNALYIPVLGTVANIAVFIQLVRGKPAVWDKKCNLIVVHKPLGSEFVGGMLLLGLAVGGLCLCYPTFIKPQITSPSNVTVDASANVPSTASPSPTLPLTTPPTTSGSDWGLPIHLGESIDKVHQIWGIPAPGNLLNADTCEALASQRPSIYSQTDIASWRNRTPNLETDMYLSYNTSLAFDKGHLVKITLSNWSDPNERVASYQGPIVKSLVLGDTRKTLFEKLGAPTPVSRDAVPDEISFLYMNPSDGISTHYSCDLGNIYVFVEVRDRDEKISDNITMPKDSISCVTIIQHLPVDRYPPMTMAYSKPERVIVSPSALPSPPGFVPEQSINGEAARKLGLSYLNSKPPDVADALKWLRMAANQGDAEAQNAIGSMYENGQGVAQDYSQALSWYQKAADQGLATAQYDIGMMYFNGEGVEKDYGQALSWYQKAAAQGDAHAQYDIGFMYENGQGVTQDYGQAFIWFKKAAEQGKADAQYNIGLMYEDGLGVEKDYSQALNWLQKAAIQGDPFAQYSIGSMYESGRGVTKDIPTAVEWYKKAAAQGAPDAQAALKRLGYSQ